MQSGISRLKNPRAILQIEEDVVAFSSRGSSGTEEAGFSLVKEAATTFRDTWMPLEVCLTLRDQLAAETEQADRLATLFQSVRPILERFRNTELQQLIPAQLVGGWALCAETVEYVVGQIQQLRPSAVLEFGAGTSTLALAWIMTQLYGTSPRPYLFSIDQSQLYIEQTKALLLRHGLIDRVHFLQADLVPQTIGSQATRCYDLPPDALEQFFAGVRPEMVLVDGPAGEDGIRFGTVPLVRDCVALNAAVFLDDGLRDSELRTADQWNRLGYVRWEGVRWEGKGLLGGRICPAPDMPIQRWLERAQSVSRPPTWYRSAPEMSSGETAQRKNNVTPPALCQIVSHCDDRDSRNHSHRPPSRRELQTCLFLNTYYLGFLEHHYRLRPELLEASYESQHKALQAACFGDSDFYSAGLRNAGWAAEDLIVNCSSLQRQWASEHGIDPTLSPVGMALEQIARIRPQVFYLQDLALGTREFLSAVRPHVELIVGQIASPIPSQTYLDGFDILISSFPHFVDVFRSQGRVAYYQPLAFDPRLLQRLGGHKREYPLTFVGGLSPAHRERQGFLVTLTKSLPIHCWGYGTQALTQQGVDISRLRGDAWGLDMFSVLTRSAITVNHHIDIAKSNANNMRLFEATGCGALLVTDYKDNLSDLFDIGSEVVAYRSVDECVDLISYYLTHEDEAAEIARRGQERTLRDHTYEIRMRQTAELLSRNLERKRGTNCLPDPDMTRISYGRVEIEPRQISTELVRSWRSDRIPLKQRALVQHELEDMYRGNPPVVFRVLADALRPHIRPNIELLEIGCASGYYYEVLEYLLNVRLSYLGVDFSDAMIRLARSYYQQARFEVGDGGALRFQERSIPIVVSSGVLLHVREHAMHIAEAARVSSEVAVFHRTPISRRTMTKHFKKFAYGVETFELRFNEEEFFGICRKSGLELIAQHDVASHPEHDEFEITYVFRAGTERA